MASQGATTFNALVQHLPTPLQTYLDAAVQQLAHVYTQLPQPARSYLNEAAEISKLNTPAGLAGTTLLILATAVAMSRWSPAYWGQRLSPFDRTTPPVITDADFSYIPSTDLEEPARTYDQASTSNRIPISSDLEDDTIRLKNKGREYALKFPAFSIGDGKLLVRDLRDRAALALGVKNRPIKLLYKGRQLKDDEALCRDYNLKDKSEVLCIVGDHEVVESDGESETGTATSKDSKKKRVRKRGKKSKGKKKGTAEEDDYALPSREVPKEQQTPLQKLEGISSNFHTTLIPLCVQYMANPPEDPKKKDFEHKKLSETIMQQVLLKLDGVDTQGDETARAFRKNLVKETQKVLHGLDDAAGVPHQS